MVSAWAVRGRAERLAGRAAYENITSNELERFELADWDRLARRTGIMQMPGRTERIMALNLVRAVEEAEHLLHRDGGE